MFADGPPWSRWAGCSWLLPPSHRLCVDCVVPRVRPDESYIDDTVRVVDQDNDPVFVPGDVEDHPTALEYARVREVPLHIRSGGPVRLQDVSIPRQGRLPGVREGWGIVPELLRRGEGDDPHERSIVPFWDSRKRAPAQDAKVSQEGARPRHPVPETPGDAGGSTRRPGHSL